MSTYAFFMPHPAQPAPQRALNSFGDLLASFTSKLQSDGWDDSALEDDVTTISYEQALSSARRSRMPKDAARSLVPDESQTGEVLSTQVRKTRCYPEKKHKGASITIRVTAEEHAQLHERAAAAQVSVSAYLRSCIFEAEALRAEVKEALAQIQTVPAAPNSPNLDATSCRRWRFFRAWWPGRTAES